MPHVIEFIAHVIESRFPNGVSYSVETGCGLSTILLSHLSKRHTCFTLGGDNDDSLTKTLAHPLLDKSNVEFIEGPSQITLAKHTWDTKIDFALIDGAHAYPFPELDYFHIYPHLNPWATLVIDDVHIPTIGRLFDFLKEDDMFDYFATVATTAFLTRNASPTFYPYGDGWTLQKYNANRFGKIEI